MATAAVSQRRFGMPPKLEKGVKTGRIQVVAPVTWVKRVNEWRRAHPDMPNQSKAVRMLVDLALEGLKSAKPEKPKGKRG